MGPLTWRNRSAERYSWMLSALLCWAMLGSLTEGEGTCGWRQLLA